MSTYNSLNLVIWSFGEWSLYSSLPPPILWTIRTNKNRGLGDLSRNLEKSDNWGSFILMATKAIQAQDVGLQYSGILKSLILNYLYLFLYQNIYFHQPWNCHCHACYDVNMIFKAKSAMRGSLTIWQFSILVSFSK